MELNPYFPTFPWILVILFPCNFYYKFSFSLHFLIQKKKKKFTKTTLEMEFAWGTNCDEMLFVMRKKKIKTPEVGRYLTRLSYRPYKGRRGVSLSYFRFPVQLLEIKLAVLRNCDLRMQNIKEGRDIVMPWLLCYF
jgi:hypothetical protein